VRLFFLQAVHENLPLWPVFSQHTLNIPSFKSKMNHPFPMDDLLLPWSLCEDYLTWMSLEGKILIGKFFFQGILQLLPLLAEFTSWSFFLRYCSLFPGFRREEVSPSKCLHFIAVLTKIELTCTEGSKKAAAAKSFLMWRTERSQNKYFFLPLVARDMETPWCETNSWGLNLSL